MFRGPPGAPAAVPPPTLFRTPETSNYGVEFSPFRDGLMAIASSMYFGIVGNGRQYVVQLDPSAPGGVRVVRMFETQDGLFDVSWNESNEHQLVSASGDGSVQLFDLNARDNLPVARWKEHTHECCSVDWSLIKKDCFVSASWDKTCKLWDPAIPGHSVRTFAEHTATVYNAVWSPRTPGAFVSCSGDATFKIWDVQAPRSALTVPGHQGEILAIDWSKYDEFTIVTGATDRTLCVWDVRKPMQPTAVLGGHDYALRRLKCSPVDGRKVLTCSYDMTAMLWDVYSEDGVLLRADHHSEFVFGIDFNLFRPNQVATASWDEYVCVFDVSTGVPPPKIPTTHKKKKPGPIMG